MKNKSGPQGQPNSQNLQKQKQSEQQRQPVANKNQLDSRENLELNDPDEGGGHNRKATHEGDHAKTELNDRRGTPPGPGNA